MRSFSIKELADMMGVSRDTLRIYEEAGLLSPERDRNGFRRYREEDVYRLISIKFYRDSAVSLKEIGVLMREDSEAGQLDVIDRRIAEEREAAERHRQNAARLEVARLYYGRSEEAGFSADRCGEDFYRMSPAREDFLETVRDYFQMGGENPMLRSCYLSGEYDAGRPGEGPERSFLLLKRRELTALGLQGEELETIALGGRLCVRGLVRSEKPLPSREQLRALAGYAAGLGLPPAGPVYGYYLYRYLSRGKPVFIVELWAPVAGEGESGGELSGPRP